MATASQILAEFRTAMAALATSRLPAKNFKEAPSNAPFEPQAGDDAFYVSAANQTAGQEFGRAGWKQDELEVVVELGHLPGGTEKAREKYVHDDIERVRDTLSSRDWTTPGIEAVFFEGNTPPNRFSKAWWVTALTFRVVFAGAVRS